MRYQDAMDLVVQGKYVARDAWKAQDSFLFSVPGITHLFKRDLQPSPQVVAWGANLEDSLAEDWSEIA